MAGHHGIVSLAKMDVVLKFPCQKELITGISDFTYAWGINCGLLAFRSRHLSLAVTELVSNIIQFAFGSPNEEFVITFRSTARHVEVIVHEFGEPFDPDLHPYNRAKAVDQGDFEGAGMFLIRKFSDDFFFLNKGKEGKEFRILMYLIDPHIAELFDATEIVNSESRPTSDDYLIREIIEEDAETIARLIYRTYRHSYYKAAMYYPKKIAKAIQKDRKYGVLTETAQGDPAGYFAVIIRPDSHIGEVGEAVVLADHRRRGLMKAMLRRLIEIGRDKKLKGVFGEANAAHLFSQKANAFFNFKSTALLLSVIPAMKMSGFREEQVNQNVCAVIDFLPLENRTKPYDVYLPACYQEIIKAVFDQFDHHYRIHIGAGQEPSPDEKTSQVDIHILYEEKMAEIIVVQYGPDFAGLMQQTFIDLKTKELETLHIDLPLQDAFTPWAVDVLRAQGFIFCGLMPFFHHEQDYFRMQHTDAMLDFNKIKAFSPVAVKLKALVEQEYYAGREIQR